ncbi:efflux transporter outer membrane subunit [Asaia lannensis]|uniref:Efflux transporter outer membrane subunit n=1 Tax=Asaia lannensis NBRC 102526 TaxID=1307926 RepID=A0ABT1CLK1_9PROT|nr:efflux transporter outer membrane subunit [Asaia lannensis]MCO6161083.1 efflux transporter outer membrane subunit [Asaia lannensis NBRC 102526]GBQ94308.1 secretion system type I outer membrane efflux pump lipoprotein NodT [Asaia lannensis NBRC 102526]
MSLMTKSRSVSALMAFTMLASCNLAPKYERPTQPVQNSYPADSGRTQPLKGQAAADIGWKHFFTDARLRALIELALKNNRDLRSQAAAIMEAQGSYDVQHASLFPPIGVSGQGQFLAPSETAGFSFAPGLGRSTSMLRYYGLGIGFSSYEVDLFGRIRNLSRQQAEELLGSRMNAQSVLISTVSQVANTYLQWLADRELVRVTNQTLTSQSDTLRLTQMKYDHGEADALTLAQTQTQVEQAASNKAQYERQMAQDEHQLQLLVGVPLPDTLPPPQPFGAQTLLSDLPAGLPSDLIAQRPDIQTEEHKLMGANANIGAARAAFFPKVTLTAQEGVSSLQFRHLFTPGAQTWSVSPNIELPIFTWGQNEGNLKVSKARRLAQIATYEKTVQTAFKEVSDALTARETYLAQDAHMKGLVQSSKQAYDLAMMRYNTGIDPYLTTLTQQRSLYDAQQSLIVVQLARYQNLVTLYRALGGGWSASDVAASAALPSTPGKG